MFPRKPLTVLIVEDDEDTSALYVDVLTRAGFVAHAVDDIPHARKMMENVRVDVLLADYELPSGTASDLLEAPDAVAPPICIVISGHRAGAVDSANFHAVLTKPVDIGVLIDTIHAHCRTEPNDGTG